MTLKLVLIVIFVFCILYKYCYVEFCICIIYLYVFFCFFYFRIFNFDEFKREYFNKDILIEVLFYFWKNFDKENYFIWFCEYKYNDELVKIFMILNFIRGEFI